MKKTILFALLTACCFFLAAENKEEAVADSLGNPIKKGWSILPLPSVSYDVDKGFCFGLVANIYDYADGKLYPNYRHYMYAEASYSTRKVGTFRLFFESDNVLKNHKLLFDLSYLPDHTSDFYGFNGSQSVFNHDFEDPASKNYVNRYFYRHGSNLLRVAADVRGHFFRDFYWNGGIGLLRYEEGRVMLSKAQQAEQQNELFNLYREWNIISNDEESGGLHPYIRLGLTYDTRNQRVNTVKGLYFDLFVTYNMAFDLIKKYNNCKLNFDFMHFVPLFRDRIVFAYRLSTQNTIAGCSPFYIDTYQNVLYIDHNRYYGLGGATSLRGVMRNRIWAPGFAYATAELRSRIWRFDLVNQHFYIGANAFIDVGMVTQKYDIDEEKLRQTIDNQLSDPDSWMSQNHKSFDDFFDMDANVFAPHFGAGCGLKLAMNENFVLSCEMGVPFSKQDNYSDLNLYVGMGFMF